MPRTNDGINSGTRHASFVRWIVAAFPVAANGSSSTAGRWSYIPERIFVRKDSIPFRRVCGCGRTANVSFIWHSNTLKTAQLFSFSSHSPHDQKSSQFCHWLGAFCIAKRSLRSDVKQKKTGARNILAPPSQFQCSPRENSNAKFNSASVTYVDCTVSHVWLCALCGRRHIGCSHARVGYMAVRRWDAVRKQWIVCAYCSHCETKAIFNNNVSMPLSFGWRVLRIRFHISLPPLDILFRFSFFSIWLDEASLSPTSIVWCVWSVWFATLSKYCV